MFAKSLLVTGASLVLLGPPRIAVQTDNLSGNALAMIDAHYHTDAKDARVYATLYSWTGNQRTERSVPLSNVAEYRYRLDRTWTTSTPVVLVVGVEQGDHGEHGVAEALIRVNREGRVAGVDIPTNRRDGHDIPRRITAREIDGALRALGARAAD